MSTVPEAVDFEATVVTGLEKIAAEECKEKLAIEDVESEQGKVRFRTATDVSRLLSLRSVDNVSVVVHRSEMAILPSNKEELQKVLQEHFEQLDWKQALNTWCKAFKHEYDVDTILDENAEESSAKPPFRVTCHRVGEHSFTSMEAASIFGALINDKYHWPVSMEKYQLEVLLNIREREFYVALALTHKSLHYRNLVAFGPTSLRATICHNMLRLAEIKPGDVVCDPMCGSGAISVESSISWPLCFNVAGDNHSKAIEHVSSNLATSSEGPTDVMELDVQSLPFRNESVDVFITDLPFGKRMGSKRNNRTLYENAVKEMARCARLTSGRAVLLTQDKKNMNYALGGNIVKKYWRRSRMVFVKIGGLAASVYCLSRNSIPY